MGLLSRLTSAPLEQKIDTALLLLAKIQNEPNGYHRRHDKHCWPAIAYAAYTKAGSDMEEVWQVFQKEDHALWDSSGFRLDPPFSRADMAVLDKVIVFGNRVLDNGIELDETARQAIANLATTLPKEATVISLDEFRAAMRKEGREVGSLLRS